MYIKDLAACRENLSLCLDAASWLEHYWGRTLGAGVFNIFLTEVGSVSSYDDLNDTPPAPPSSIDAEPLSVTEVVSLLNTVLDDGLPRIKFQGELSEVKKWGSSGHIYCTLKDSSSQISAVIWKGVSQTLKFQPKDGLQVLCVGRPSVWNKSGRLQFQILFMTPMGEGLLQKLFQELKAKLHAEGLFAPERKRPLPFFPRAVGVVTSPTGAVIHDIMVKIRERMPSIKVILAPVKVQGDGASEEIAQGIRDLGRSGFVDVIIVARGGGSLQDLWSFNEEVVARAIFASPVPVVSGVGHEVDITLSDLVADLRAPTPTAAAEMVVPKASDLKANLSEYQRRINDLDRWFSPFGMELDQLEQTLSDGARHILREALVKIQGVDNRLLSIRPNALIERVKGTVVSLESRLYFQTERRLRNGHQMLNSLDVRLGSSRNQLSTAQYAEKANALYQRLSRAFKNNLANSEAQVESLGALLEFVSHQRVLERGYAILRDPSGTVVRSRNALTINEKLRVQVADGEVGAVVTELK